jgi:hypothetical protein
VAVEDAYELAYREAVRALDHQLATLTELRSRAGMLLAAAAIAVSMLGRETFRGTPPIAWMALVCFGLLTVCVSAIVWPQSDVGVDLDPRALLDAHLSADRPTLVDMTLASIAHMARHLRANDRRLARDVRIFRVGACLLTTQIVLTSVAASATSGARAAAQSADSRSVHLARPPGPDSRPAAAAHAAGSGASVGSVAPAAAGLSARLRSSAPCGSTSTRGRSTRWRSTGC